MEKKRVTKGWAVIKRSPFHPADWFGAYTVFRLKKDALYWMKTRVHPSNNPKVVPAEITY